MIRINCDIGERGSDHPVDRELMNYIRIANIACGGHAGDSDSVAVFTRLAAERGGEVAAHLSYPDREQFGRRILAIPFPALLESLDRQLAMLPGVKRVKFHGALYNQTGGDEPLANKLAGWLIARGITEVLTPGDSALAWECRRLGIMVQREAFAERRYCLAGPEWRLELVDRRLAHACITGVGEAVTQAVEIIDHNRVEVFATNGISIGFCTLAADTVCIHSDSLIALDLARCLSSLGTVRGG
jgi:5-oxoprolinase (ATP-hydrolysing) subunit A